MARERPGSLDARRGVEDVRSKEDREERDVPLPIRKRGLMCVGGPGIGLVESGGNDSGARGWQRRRIWSSATSGAPSCSRALLRSPIPHYRTSAVGTRRGLEEAPERHGPRGGNRWNDPSRELAGRA